MTDQYVKNHPFLKFDEAPYSRTAQATPDDLTDIFSDVNNRLEQPDDKDLRSTVEKAANLLADVFNQFDLPMQPQSRFINLKNIKFAKHDPQEVVAATLMFETELVTPTGVRKHLMVPMSVSAGEVMTPSMFELDGAQALLSQQNLNDVMDRNSSFYLPQVREGYEPPLVGMEREVAVGLRNDEGWQPTPHDPTAFMQQKRSSLLDFFSQDDEDDEEEPWVNPETGVAEEDDDSGYKVDWSKKTKPQRGKDIGVYGRKRRAEAWNNPKKLLNVTYDILDDGSVVVPEDSMQGIDYAEFGNETEARDYINSKVGSKKRRSADLQEAKSLWAEFGDIPVNEDGDIEEAFLDFPVGTDQLEIWHWFEDEFNLSVAEDLMYGKQASKGKSRLRNMSKRNKPFAKKSGYMPPSAYPLVKEAIEKAEKDGSDTFPRAYDHILRQYILEFVSTASKDAWMIPLINDGYCLNPYGVNTRRKRAQFLDKEIELEVSDDIEEVSDIISDIDPDLEEAIERFYEGTKTPIEVSDSVKWNSSDGKMKGTIVEVGEDDFIIIKGKGHEYRVGLDSVEPMPSTFQKMYK